MPVYYKSSDPKIVDPVESMMRASREFSDVYEAWKNTHPFIEGVYASSFSSAPVGITLRNGSVPPEFAELVNSFRQLKRNRYLVPRLGKPGRLARELLESIPMRPDKNAIARSVGLDTAWMVIDRVYRPTLLAFDGVAYAGYNAPEKQPESQQWAPPSPWVPCKASEYHKAFEDYNEKYAV